MGKPCLDSASQVSSHLFPSELNQIENECPLEKVTGEYEDPRYEVFGYEPTEEGSLKEWDLMIENGVA